jgi:hypothetical protein
MVRAAPLPPCSGPSGPHDRVHFTRSGRAHVAPLLADNLHSNLSPGRPHCSLCSTARQRCAGELPRLAHALAARGRADQSPGWPGSPDASLIERDPSEKDWLTVLRLHHLNNSRSQRVLWLLEELGLEYELVRYERDRKTMLAPARLREVHPLGKSPVLEDNDLLIAESGAILEHLVERYGPHLAPPPEAPDRARYLQWMHYAVRRHAKPLRWRHEEPGHPA